MCKSLNYDKSLFVYLHSISTGLYILNYCYVWIKIDQKEAAADITHLLIVNMIMFAKPTQQDQCEVLVLICISHYLKPFLQQLEHLKEPIWQHTSQRFTSILFLIIT